MSIPHYIRHNKRVFTPRRCLFVDTETRESREGQTAKHRAFMVAAIYATRSRSGSLAIRDSRVFLSISEFHNYLISLLRPREALWLFAHKAEFDVFAAALMDLLINNLGVRSLPASGQGRFFWRARTERGTLVVVDTLNFFDASVQEIGRWVGLEKLKMPDPDADLAEWAAYCMRDVEIIYRAMSRVFDLIRQEQLGSFSPTLASTAFSIYRHRFMPPRSILSHQRRRVTRLERDAHYGGRAEPWWMGHYEGSVFYLDVNSMYASVMRDLDAPVRLEAYIPDGSVAQLLRAMRDRFVIADVLVEVEEPVAPCRRDGVVLYPVGRFWTTLASPELELVMKKGRILNVGRMAIYRTARIFREFVDYCWEKRHEALAAGDAVGARFWKRIMNSVYGKFAQYGYEQHVRRMDDGFEGVLVENVVVADTGKRITFFRVNEDMIWMERTPLHRDGLVAVAAAVTSAARVRLWEIIEKAGVENVLYVDTDAVMVTLQGRMRLEGMIGDGLGMLKEKWASTGVRILGSKRYLSEVARALASIPRDAVAVEGGKVKVRTMSHWQSQLARSELAAVTFVEGVKTIRPGTKIRAGGHGATLPVRLEDDAASPPPALASARAPSPSRAPSR